jgi:uncharacterized protein
MAEVEGSSPSVPIYDYEGDDSLERVNNVSDKSMKEQIKKLIEVQKLDSDIYRLKHDLIEKPTQINQLKETFEQNKQKLNDLEKKYKDIQLARKSIELELKSKEDAIAKLNSQLAQLKTNKEYSAKLTEIESAKADKSQYEEKIILSYDDSDKVQGEIDKEKKEVTVKEKHFLEQKKIIEQDIKAAEDKIKALEDVRQELIPDIDTTVLTRYEKILKHKEGLAIVPLRGHACGGCFMNATPQTINLVGMNDTLIECEICSRILYSEDAL